MIGIYYGITGFGASGFWDFRALGLQEFLPPIPS
jgi:hypothetical protein